MAYPPFHPRRRGPQPMTMTLGEFSAAFPTESDVVERKTGTGSRPLQDSIVAFSNTAGGVILIGVTNSGQVAGRELTQGVADDLHQILGDVRDPGRYELHPLVVDGKPITILSIAQRIEGFSQTSNGRVLVRRGTREVALFGAELRLFLNQRSLGRFEETPTGIAVSDASPRLVGEIANAYDWSDPSNHAVRLEERGLVARNGPELQLTVAGALYLLASPQERLGKAYVEVLRFAEGATDYDRRVEIGGPLHVQVEATTNLVMSELGSELVVLGLRRHEIPRLPRVVLREAIANALAHRSYELTGSPVRVELRPTHVKIASPGGLPEPVTVQNIRETQAARNLHVIALLRRFGLAEDVGRGVDVMEDSMRQELLEPPQFVDTGHAVEVTLPIRSAVAPSERAWVRELEHRGTIAPSDRVVLIHAARGEVLTNGRVRELLNVDPDAARECLQRLRDAGFLTQRGQRGGATYVLQESLAPPAGLRLRRNELADLVVQMAREEHLTNARIRARTGLDRAEALRVLDGLVSAGRLRRVGQRRGTHYVIAD
jgi:ATP-dependent DNA helicase RecG